MTLYRHEPVLDHLVPRLVGLESQRNYRLDPYRRVPAHLRADRPVVEVAGGRGSGKTRLLNLLCDAYQSRVPVARVDLSAPGFGEVTLADAGLRDTANASPMTDLLYLLSFKLGQDVGAIGGKVPFPRLYVGLMLVTAWQADGQGVNPAQLQSAQDKVRNGLSNGDDDRRRRRAVLAAWLDLLRGLLPIVSGLPIPPAVPEIVLETAKQQLLAARPDRTAVKWWDSLFTNLALFGGVGPFARLLNFVSLFQQGHDSRRYAEGLLVRAFLADIAEHTKHFRPLILLDNLHAPTGARFKELLLKAYADPGDNRPVVVATALGSHAEERAHAFDEVAEHTPWPAPEHATPDSWLLRLTIPEVQTHQLLGVLSDVDYPHGLPQLIIRLSGGRAGCADVLVRSARAALLSHRKLADGDVLRLPVAEAAGGRDDAGGLHPGSLAGAADVGDWLAKRFLPDPHVRHDAMLFASALDATAAQKLCRELALSAIRGDGPAADQRTQDVTKELDGTHWNRQPWPWPVDALGTRGTRAVPVADRGLRAVLLHRLATGADQPDRSDEVAARTRFHERWSQIHRRLRAGYNPESRKNGDVGHTVEYLHHTLALGDIAAVVRNLHHRLKVTDASNWLEVVNAICAAPRPPDGFPCDATIDPCPACNPGGADNQHADNQHRAIAGLVEALWRASDPRTLPRDWDVDRVEAALWELYSSDYQDALAAAWRTWPSRLRDGLQAPDLPVADLSAQGSGS